MEYFNIEWRRRRYGACANRGPRKAQLCGVEAEQRSEPEMPWNVKHGMASQAIRSLRRRRGAGDGNRTHATSLEGWSSTIELHPRLNARFIISFILSLVKHFFKNLIYFLSRHFSIASPKKDCYYCNPKGINCERRQNYDNLSYDRG